MGKIFHGGAWFSADGQQFGDLCSIGHVWVELSNLWFRVPAYWASSPWGSQELILLVVVWGRWGLFFPSYAQPDPLASQMTFPTRYKWPDRALDFFILQHFISIGKLKKCVNDFIMFPSHTLFSFCGAGYETKSPICVHMLSY